MIDKNLMVELVKKEVTDRPYIRVGQSLFNTIANNYPLYDSFLRGSIYDTFHNYEMTIDDISSYIDKINEFLIL